MSILRDVVYLLKQYSCGILKLFFVLWPFGYEAVSLCLSLDAKLFRNVLWLLIFAACTRNCTRYGCAVNGAQKCDQCDPGFSLTSTNTCIPSILSIDLRYKIYLCGIVQIMPTIGYIDIAYIDASGQYETIMYVIRGLSTMNF